MGLAHRFCLLALLGFAAASCMPAGPGLSRLPPVAETWARETVYFLLVDRFRNGDPRNDYQVDRGNLLSYHGGDLRGLTEKLEYVTGLNVGTILFTPLMDNRNTPFFGSWGFHGYWIVDHYRLDEHWGEERDLAAFTARRLQSGRKLLLDVVLNHVDWDHPWVKDHPDWFNQLPSITDWNDPEELVRGRISGLPDLDQDHPAVYAELVRYTKHWIDLTQADGLRLDAVKHIEHRFWRRYLAEIARYAREKHGKEAFLFLGELLHGDPRTYRPYFEDGFNGFYDYPLYYTVADVFARSQPLVRLPSRLQELDQAFPPGLVLATFVDNHDMPRFLSLGDQVEVRDLHQALTFYLTVRGTPVIYYGTEARMTGKTGELGRHSLDFQNTPDYAWLARLLALRRGSPSLSVGRREDLLADETSYVFRKITADEESLVLLARGPAPRTLEVPLAQTSLFAGQKEVRDQLSERTFPIVNGVLRARLGPKDEAVLTLRGRSPHFEKLSRDRPETVRLRLILEADRVPEGEALYLVGRGDALGSWDPGRALGPMPRHSPKRFSLSLLAQVGQVLEYKFLRRRPDGAVVWEENPNRYLLVKQGQRPVRHRWGMVRAP